MTRPGRWLRARRTRIALLIAIVEGVLIVLHVIPSWAALAVAIGVVSLYLLVGRKVEADSVRQTAWIAAFWQAFVALIPLLVFVLTALAVVAVGVLAVVALFALLSDRR